MQRRLRRFGHSLALAFVLAATLVAASTATPAAWGAEFGLHYKSTSGQEGYAASPKDVTTEVLSLKEMFLGEVVNFVSSNDFNGGTWQQSWRLENRDIERIEFFDGGVGTGRMHFPTTVKPGEVGRVVLWTKAFPTLEEASFDLKGIVAKSPVQVHLDKAAVTIDTAAASRDEIVVSLTHEKGAVSEDLKIVGVALSFDLASLDAAKFVLKWDGADKIQAEATDPSYDVKNVPVKAEVGLTFVGWDGQNWALSEDVNFTVTSGPGHPATVTVTATAGAGGTIAPSGAVTVTYGADQAFTISADVNYKIKDVKVNGASVGAVPTHTMKNVTADGTIEATFESTGGGGGGGGGGCDAGVSGVMLALAGLFLLRRKAS